MILDPTVLICCDKCSVTEEAPMVPFADGWKPGNIAVYLMSIGWRIVGETHICEECSEEA